jgi:quinol monooxygenase YgiN
MQTIQSGKTIVIVAYKPKPGKEADLLQLTREHVPLLRAEGLATGHPVTACQAKDGTIVEVFEWADGGVERAHTNPVVMKLWERYAAACDIVPLTSLPEASTMFASFTPLDL